MNPALIIPLIQGLASLAQQLGPIVQDALKVANSDDQAAIKAALSDLQAKVDIQHAETQALLRG